MYAHKHVHMYTHSNCSSNIIRPPHVQVYCPEVREEKEKVNIKPWPWGQIHPACCLCKSSFMGTQSIYDSRAEYLQQSTWATKPKAFSIWPFTEKSLLTPRMERQSQLWSKVRGLCRSHLVLGKGRRVAAGLPHVGGMCYI